MATKIHYNGTKMLVHSSEPLELINEAGESKTLGNRVTLCGCGFSKDEYNICDGSHNMIE